MKIYYFFYRIFTIQFILRYEKNDAAFEKTFGCQPHSMRLGETVTGKHGGTQFKCVGKCLFIDTRASKAE